MSAGQIATKAGGSIATLYKVLSNSSEISRKTVEHVQNVMRENGMPSPSDVYTRERGKKTKASVNETQSVSFVILGFNLSYEGELE